MYRICLSTIVLFAWLPFFVSAQAPHSLIGKVISGEDQKPLPWANVFLSNTSVGTQTDMEGHFKLQNLSAGNFKLVASFVGYESIVIDVRPQEQKSYTIVLKPSIKNLKEVIIRGKSLSASERTKNMKDFRENFIGLSENARFCTIANPSALEFKREALVLEATSDSLLIIENGGLGYRLKFLLEEFTLNTLTKKLLYKGQVVYERLLPKNEKEEKHWAANRLKAYNGSELHFMRALYHHRLSEEGFFINVFKDKKKIDGTIVNSAVPDTSIVIKSKLYNRRISMPTIYKYNRITDSLASIASGQPVLSFDGQLEVIYVHEGEPYEYFKRRGSGGMQNTSPQKSRLYLLDSGVTVEPNGMILSEENLPTLGYWSWELVAESLPVDYDPEDDQKTLIRLKR
jgi:hypothetical protein